MKHANKSIQVTRKGANESTQVSMKDANKSTQVTKKHANATVRIDNGSLRFIQSQPIDVFRYHIVFITVKSV